MAQSLARIQLSHLIPQEGEPDPNYVAAVTQLTNALRNDHACVLKFDPAEALVLKNGLLHASPNFEKQRNRGPQMQIEGGKLDGDIVGGYHALPEKEIYNIMLGERPHDQPFFDSFRALSQASRHVLRGLAWGLHVDTSLFEPLLDNAPLRAPSFTTSMLTYIAYEGGASVKEEAGGESIACLSHIDQGLLTIVMADQPGLEVFSNGSWQLVDANLAADELVLFPGQALTEATAGLIEAAEHRVTHVSSTSAKRGRLAAAFKCRPRLEATFDRGPIYAAHPSVGMAYATTKRLLSVAVYVADINARYESVNDVKSMNDVKVKKEEYVDNYENDASRAVDPVTSDAPKMDEDNLGPSVEAIAELEPVVKKPKVNAEKKAEPPKRRQPPRRVGDRETAEAPRRWRRPPANNSNGRKD